MNKLHYFPCLVRDVLSSSTIELMSGDAFKAYWILLCRSWLENERATLPNDQAKLQALARVDATKWASIKDEVMACFQVNSNGRLFNEKLLSLSDIQEKKSKAGSKGGSKTQANRQAKVVASESESDTSSERELDTKEEVKSVPKPTASQPKPYRERVESYFKEIDKEQMRIWAEAYPNVDLEQELKKAKAWLLTNTNKAKKDFARFSNNWLSKSMEFNKSSHSGTSRSDMPDHIIAGSAKEKRWLEDHGIGEKSRI